MSRRSDNHSKRALWRTAAPRSMTLTLGAVLCWCSIPAHSDPSANDYPTTARVEFVQDCMGRHGGKLEYLYKCSCVIDRIAEKLSYDEYVEASTFAHYSTLPGEGGGIFRDSDEAKERAKLYRSLESSAYKSCGIAPPGTDNSKR